MDREQHVRPEDLYPLKELRTKLRRRFNLGQIYRWANKGIRGVRLETVRLGDIIHTCDQWVMEFAQRDAAPAISLEQPKRPPHGRQGRTPAQKQRDIDRAALEWKRGLTPAGNTR